MSIHWPDIVDGTWPAARYERLGPFQLREGQGGGSRVSAANALDTVAEADIDAAEAAMQAMGQKRIFCLRPGDEAFDAQLTTRGYDVLDPVNIYACPVDHLTDLPIPRVTVFPTWEPLAIMREIWTQGGIGPARIAVMERAKGPKTGLLLRRDDHAAGTGFVAIQDGIAMVHALEILPEYRRQGLGNWAMRAAAFWARDNGADTLSVICTKANDGANGLYHALGMEIVGEYHYRQLVQGESLT
ncbi:GNAT family N-acetyltransferase [Ruegeria sp.]|uniref:GNAT family N-acetyltransferase n=1 Tax=Ruegeria sp. TaxID=1879320 RepID=UPI003B59B9C6